MFETITYEQYTKIEPISINTNNTKSEPTMFSFSHPSEEAENTPFFQDNEQKPSLFNSQASDQPSAFDLFNNVSASSNFIRSEQGVEKQKGRQSKKSIIMELDQFDRREAFSNLNSSIEQSHYFSQSNLNAIEKNPMAESVVRHFQSNQVFADSQCVNKGKEKQESNQNLRLKFQPSLKDQMKKKQPSNLFSKLALRMQKQPTIQPKAPFDSVKQVGQKNQITQRIMLGGSKNEDATIKESSKLQNNFNISTSAMVKQAKGRNQEPAGTQRIGRNPTSQNQLFKSESENDSKSTKQFVFNSLTFQNMFKQTSDVRTSRVSSVSSVEGKEQTTPKVNSAESGLISKIENERINLSNILKKSRIAEIEPKAQNEMKKQTNSIALKGVLTQIKKPVQNEKKPQDPAYKLNIKIGSLNIKNGTQKIDQKSSKSEIKTCQIAKQPGRSADGQNKLEIQKKEEHSLLGLKLNKVKQKPCFNLKLLKEPSKIEHKIEAQKKSQTNNYIKEQQISKREDIATARLLKNVVFTNGLSFQAAGLNKPNKEGQDNKKPQETPKITKIEQKNIKLIGNRETEKLKQDQHKINTEAAEVASVSAVEENHRVDFERYQKEMEYLQDEIEQTKKKYLSCDQSYKEIFLLLNRTNAMLNDKFMSQTQANDTKEKTQ